MSVIFQKMLAQSIPCGTSFLADLTDYRRMIDMEGFNMDTKVSSHLICLVKNIRMTPPTPHTPPPTHFTEWTQKELFPDAQIVPNKRQIKWDFPWYSAWSYIRADNPHTGTHWHQEQKFWILSFHQLQAILKIKIFYLFRWIIIRTDSYWLRLRKIVGLYREELCSLCLWARKAFRVLQSLEQRSHT